MSVINAVAEDKCFNDFWLLVVQLQLFLQIGLKLGEEWDLRTANSVCKRFEV